MTPRPSAARRSGFTLLEVLISVGIIALVVGIAIPMILRSRTKAFVIRTRADLNTIAGALDEYKATFGDYPRFADPVDDVASASNPGSGTWLDYSTDRGARLLCRALLGPGPAGGQPSNKLVALPGDDGADGYGFRTRRSVAGGSTGGGGVLSGKVFGPYLDPAKFKVEVDPNLNGQDAKLLDLFGNPILYYPAQPGPKQLAVAGGYVAEMNPQSYTPGQVRPLYNALDNQVDSTPAAMNRTMLPTTQMQYILGDRDCEGKIDVADGESAVTTAPYLLWSAGPDGAYGFQGASKTATKFTGYKTDDVVYNVDIPGGLVK